MGRKLLLWKLGVISVEAIKCAACRDNETSPRDHIMYVLVDLESCEALSANVINSLDNILNEDVAIKEGGGKDRRIADRVHNVEVSGTQLELHTKYSYKTTKTRPQDADRKVIAIRS